MDTAYHRQLVDRFGETDDPPLAIRRHTDRCFHQVEEVTPLGFIVEGHLLDLDDVAEARELDADGAPLPPCRPRL